MPGLLNALRKTRDYASNPLKGFAKSRENAAENKAYDEFMKTDYGSFKDANGNFADPGTGMGATTNVGDPFLFEQTGMSDTFTKSNGGLKQAATNISSGSNPMPPHDIALTSGNPFTGMDFGGSVAQVPSIAGGTTGATPPPAPSTVGIPSDPFTGIDLAAGHRPTVTNGGGTKPKVETPNISLEEILDDMYGHTSGGSAAGPGAMNLHEGTGSNAQGLKKIRF